MARKLNAIVSQRIEIAPHLIKLRVIPDGWELPEFIPGQYAALGLPGAAPRCDSSLPEETPPDPEKLIMRAYSIASSSVSREFIEFYVALVHSGALTPRLFALSVGDPLWISTKFKGMFTMSEIPGKYNIVLIATGTGVAPYMSMIRTEITEGVRHRFAVIHGAYHSIDLGYHSELKTLASISEKFTYIPVLSHAQDEKVPWHGEEGFVQKIWTHGILAQKWGLVPTPKNTHVFLCGNPMMIEAMTNLLGKEGFKKHSRKEPGEVHTEEYFARI
jgi:ferredoxin/flavodoxin---NADP+ reductase